MKTKLITDQQIIDDIIHSCDICFVGMIDNKGQAYVIPMNFGYRDNIIYLHSGQEGKHISCLEKNNRVCITFCSDRRIAYQNQEVACSYTMKSYSVLANCEISFPEEPEKKREALDILMSHYSKETFKYSDPAVRNVKIWKAEVKEFTCKEFGARHK